MLHRNGCFCIDTAANAMTQVLKKKHRTEKTILSLNFKDIILHLLINLELCLLLYLLLLLFVVIVFTGYGGFAVVKHYCCCL